MIAELQGEISNKSATHVIVNCQGVGYEVHCTVQALEQLPAIGSQGHLVIHTKVREDDITLYGFASFEERDLFRSLININGIGPKIGVAIMSTFSPDEVHTYIEEENVTALSKVPGLGPKTARRLVLELKGRLSASTDSTIPQYSIWSDLESGLSNLGYKKALIDKTIDELKKQHADESDLTVILKAALQKMSR